MELLNKVVIITGGANVILTRSDENAIYDLDKKTLREKKGIRYKKQGKNR